MKQESGSTHYYSYLCRYTRYKPMFPKYSDTTPNKRTLHFLGGYIIYKNNKYIPITFRVQKLSPCDKLFTVKSRMGISQLVKHMVGKSLHD